MSDITNDEFRTYIVNVHIQLYYTALSALGTEADAKDAVSETVIKAYEHRHQIRERAKFDAWIFRILKNEIYNIKRKQKCFIPVENIEVLWEAAMTRYLPPELMSVIECLERKFREVVILYYYESLSTKEISKFLKMPEGTVRSRLARARKQLRKLLEED